MSETAENKILEIAQRIKRNRSWSRRGRSRSRIKATPEPQGEAKKENKDLGEGRVELEKKELDGMEKGPEYRNEILDKFVDDVGDNIMGEKTTPQGGRRQAPDIACTCIRAAAGRPSPAGLP